MTGGPAAPPPPPPPPPPVRVPGTPRVPAFGSVTNAMARAAMAIAGLGLDGLRVHSVSLLAGRRPRVTMDIDDWRSLGLLGARVESRPAYTVHVADVGDIEVCCLVPRVVASVGEEPPPAVPTEDS